MKDNQAYWSGGFKHELNNMWSWCTKDSPEPIDESLITEVSADKSRIDDNCVQMAFEYSIQLTNQKCDAKFTLACESFTKSVVELVVRIYQIKNEREQYILFLTGHEKMQSAVHQQGLRQKRRGIYLFTSPKN